METKTYSQYGVLEGILEKEFPNQGFFIEIGCWDGMHKSQTYALELRGWSGICVDPFPKNFENRKARLMTCAISGGRNTRLRKFMKVSIDRRYGGDVSYFSGFVEDIKKCDEIYRIIIEHCDFEIVDVECLPVKRLLEGAPKFVEFLSIDTEGSEEEIIKGIDFEKNDFGMIMFEHNGNMDSRVNIGNHLREKGYVLHTHMKLDDIFINNHL